MQTVDTVRLKRLISTGAALLMTAWCMTAQSVRSTVYKRGDNGFDTYRIPAVIQAKDGTLLAFAEARKNSRNDTGDIDLVVRRSSDGGVTWSGIITIWDDAENVCGNPSPVVDRNTGRIVLAATWNKGTDKEKEIHARTSDDTRRVFVMYSDDNGLTWSQAREITDQAKLPEWTWYATGPCHAIQLQSGRIVVPCDHGVFSNGPAGTHSHIIYSDDIGETWHIGGDPGTGNESTVAELSNGDLMLNMRGDRSRSREHFRIVAVSHDQGLTFDTPYSEIQLAEPVCNASICNLGTGRKPSKALAFTNPCHESKRKCMTLQVSPDNGKSWSKAMLLTAGDSAYSDLLALKDGSVGVLYENGRNNPYEQISFVIISGKQVKKALKAAR